MTNSCYARTRNYKLNDKEQLPVNKGWSKTPSFNRLLFSSHAPKAVMSFLFRRMLRVSLRAFFMTL